MSTKDAWADAYQKHKEEWERYEKQMGRSAQLGNHHDFGGEDNTCIKCHVVFIDVQNGSASWTCMAKTMECCGKSGVSRWDYKKSEWRCSECDALQSTDYSYLTNPYKGSEWDFNEKPTPEPAAVIQTHPKKCDCNITLLVQRGCKCGGS